MNTNSLSWPNEVRREIKENEYPLSASATKKFNRCEEEYRLHYQSDLPATKGGSPYAELGSAVHEVIEEVLKEDREFVNRPNQLRELFLSKFRNRELALAEEHIETGLKCLKVAARYIPNRVPDEFRGIEQEFTFGLKRPDINHGFRGIMDVATHNEIWDWKTGKNAYEEDEIIQGMIYAMGYYDEYGVVPEKIRFVYLQKETERSLEPSDENWHQMLDNVRNVVDAKESGQFEAQPGSSKCYFCGMEGYCSASPVGAGNIEWELF